MFGWFEARARVMPGVGGKGRSEPLRRLLGTLGEVEGEVSTSLWWLEVSLGDTGFDGWYTRGIPVLSVGAVGEADSVGSAKSL